MRSFEIVQSETDITTSHAGLAIVGRALGQTRLGRDLDEIPLRHGIAHADCVKSYVGLVCTGKSDFDAIEAKRNDAFFHGALLAATLARRPKARIQVIGILPGGFMGYIRSARPGCRTYVHICFIVSCGEPRGLFAGGPRGPAPMRCVHYLFLWWQFLLPRLHRQ